MYITKTLLGVVLLASLCFSHPHRNDSITSTTSTTSTTPTTAEPSDSVNDQVVYIQAIRPALSE